MNNAKQLNELKRIVNKILEFERHFDSTLSPETAPVLYNEVSEWSKKLQIVINSAVVFNVRRSTIGRICEPLPNRQAYLSALIYGIG